MSYSGVKYMFMVVAAIFIGGATHAQIKLVPRTVLDSVKNTPTVQNSGMVFQQNGIFSFSTIGEDSGKWERTVEWRNDNKQSLVVTRISTSCSCLQAVAQREEVKSGGKSRIKLTYYPKGHPGKVEQRVFIYTNLSSAKPTAVLTLKGEVTPSDDKSADYPRRRGDLLLRRDTVVFSGDKLQSERIACLNNGSRPMHLEADMLSSRGLTLRTEPEVLAPGESGDLIITYKPEAESEKKPLWLKLYVKGLALPLRGRELFVQIKSEEK